jgi:two-component system nitrate/nitrite response regulator NarL
MEPLRIVLADDHALFREGLKALLSAREGIEVVGDAADGLEAQAIARATMPDLILMDTHMPRCNGLEAVKAIKREMPHIKIIMLSISDDDGDLFQAIKNGADGYLLKNLRTQQLFDMLEGVRRGEAAISGMLASKILKEFRAPELAQQDDDLWESLTEREIEILERVVAGDSNREIAEALCITRNTVKNHIQNILEKLHAQNRVQAAVYAIREGLVHKN